MECRSGVGPTPNLLRAHTARVHAATYGGQGKAAGYVPPTALLRIRKCVAASRRRGQSRHARSGGGLGRLVARNDAPG